MTDHHHSGRVTDKLNEITSSANTAGDVVNNAVNAAGTVQSEWDQLKSEFKPRGVETRKISKTGIVNAGKHIGAAGDIVNDVSNAVNNLESGIGNFVDEFKL